MKQIWLVVYLESRECEEVRRSSKGYYIMRKGNKITGVPVPSSGEFLKDETICNICNQLGVPIPPNTEEEINKMMKDLKNDVENKIKSE